MIDRSKKRQAVDALGDDPGEEDQKKQPDHGEQNSFSPSAFAIAKARELAPLPGGSGHVSTEGQAETVPLAAIKAIGLGPSATKVAPAVIPAEKNHVEGPRGNEESTG